jgi:hypothetical protein
MHPDLSMHVADSLGRLLKGEKRERRKRIDSHSFYVLKSVTDNAEGYQS